MVIQEQYQGLKNNMKVTLKAYTQPVDSDLEASEFIAYCARVSNPSNQMNTESSPKLLQYCLNHKHFSIFEMVNCVFEIETTRDIARQILRHRSFSFQEFSQRYADPTNLGWETREARLQDKKNRQNSIDLKMEDVKEFDLSFEWHTAQENVMLHALKEYKWAIENGIAKEQARVLLPEGLTTSRMYMNGTLRSWVHYCQVRMDPSTQKEHREIAITIWNVLLNKFSFLNLLKANK